MEYLSIPNWEDYQHYKDRNPPWIKLHNQLLENYDFECLPDASKAHLLCIWMLASRTSNKIKADSKWIGRKIGANEPVDLNVLIESGFLELNQGDKSSKLDASAMLHNETKSVPLEEKRREEQSKEEKKVSQKLDYSSWPNEPNKIIFNDWKRLRQIKKAPISQTVINRMASELHKALEKGFTVDQCLSEAVFKGWSGFKAEWMKPSEQNQQESSPKVKYMNIPEGS